MKAEMLDYTLMAVSRAYDFLADRFLGLTPPVLSCRLQRRLVLFVFAGAVLLSPHGRAQAGTGDPVDRSVLESALLKSFGPAVEAATMFEPYHLIGDFNGDGGADLLIVVRIKGPRTELPKDVAVVNPFYKQGPSFPVDPSREPGLGIAIIHGGKMGWLNSPMRKFLLFGESPILILENSRASSAEREDRKRLMELVKRRGKRSPTAMRPPTHARGDSVSLPTEAADSILYWNGKIYRWAESEGGE